MGVLRNDIPANAAGHQGRAASAGRRSALRSNPGRARRSRAGSDADGIEEGGRTKYVP